VIGDAQAAVAVALDQVHGSAQLQAVTDARRFASARRIAAGIGREAEAVLDVQRLPGVAAFDEQAQPGDEIGAQGGDLVVPDARNRRRQPLLLVECKWSDAEPDRSLRYLKARFPAAEAWQLSATGRNDYVTPEGIRIAPALVLLSRLI
jgi:hypothetical protein